MKSYESVGRNVEEAINAGLAHLGASISDVDITILSEGSKGLFGLFGSREAKVRLSLKQEDNIRDQTRALFADAMGTQRDEPEIAHEVSPVAVVRQTKPRDRALSEAPKKAAQPKNENVSRPLQEATANSRQEPKPLPPAEPEETAVQQDPGTPEGQAQAFLQEITRLMGVEVSVHAKQDEEGNVRVNIQGDVLGILIGRRGETLDALQYLTGLQVNKGKEGYTRVTLDSEGYRAKREEALIRLANRMANRAKKTGRRVSLEPMNPYERRILHSALQNTDGVATHSEGEEPNRHVVITLNKDYKPARSTVQQLPPSVGGGAIDESDPDV